jgi:hypothetical protein
VWPVALDGVGYMNTEDDMTERLIARVKEIENQPVNVHAEAYERLYRELRAHVEATDVTHD